MSYDKASLNNKPMFTHADLSWAVYRFLSCVEFRRSTQKFSQQRTSDFSWGSKRGILEFLCVKTQVYEANESLVGYTNRFFYDLTKWPSFLPNMTHFQTHPRFQQSNYSDQVSWISHQKLRPLECTQGFSKIWPSDLVFYPTWPIFELGI